MRRANRKEERQQQLLPPQSKPIYFASGANHPGEIRGFAAVGQPMGAAANECRGPCERELINLASSGIPVFVDSGAYGEIKFPKEGPPQVVKPISDAAWRKRLDLYERLAKALGPQLYAVAPDMIGSQSGTLKRLKQYRDQVRRIRDTGAHILVPLQGGRLSLRAFDKQVQRVLGFSDYVVALPMKKGATSVEKLEEFLRYRCPAAIHMLGLGTKNVDAPKIIALVQDNCPQTQISLDSNRLKAFVGWSYDEYLKRMKRIRVAPMPIEEWKPSHHLLLPGFRTFPAVTPREFTLAREFVGPLRPRFSTELGLVHQKDLGLKKWGIEVLSDRQMVEQVDSWLDRGSRKEMLRQRQLMDAWEEHQHEGAPRPPEAPWWPGAEEVPLRSDDPDLTESAYDITPLEAEREFLRSPHAWLHRTYGRLDKPMTPGDYRWEALKLRPFYLDYLARQRINGTTLGVAWRKEKAVRAAFGPKKKGFESWKRRAKEITSQRGYEMQLAINYEIHPEVIIGEADLEVVQRGMRYPEYEEYRLAHWAEIPLWMHVEWEGARADRLRREKGLHRVPSGEARKDPYYEWTQALYEVPNTHDAWLTNMLRTLVEMRVAERKGGVSVPPMKEMPAEVHAEAVEGYQSPPRERMAFGERVANTSYPQTIQARRVGAALMAQQRVPGLRRRLSR